MFGWRAEVKREPRDCWIGVYWTPATFSFHLYVCLIPCLPLHLWRMTAPEPPFPGAGSSQEPAPDPLPTRRELIAAVERYGHLRANVQPNEAAAVLEGIDDLLGDVYDVLDALDPA
jgi:hypothetical protein